MTNTDMPQTDLTDLTALHSGTRDAAFKKIIGQMAEFAASAEAESAVFYQQFVETVAERDEAREGIWDLMARNEQLRADLKLAEEMIERLNENLGAAMLLDPDESLPPV